MNDNLKEQLGIEDWLELIKEDKNLNGAYISIQQYVYLRDKEIKRLNKELQEFKDGRIEPDELVKMLNQELVSENKRLNNKLKMIKNNIDTITKEEILDIIENYTGFFGRK